MGEIATHVAQMLRQHRLARIAHAQIQIELGAEAHDPQNAIGHQANTVGSMRKRYDQQETQQQDEYFVPEHNPRCGPKALQARDIRRQFLAIGPGNQPTKKADLHSAPNRQGSQEGKIGPGGAHILCGLMQCDQTSRKQDH